MCLGYVCIVHRGLKIYGTPIQRLSFWDCAIEIYTVSDKITI